MQPAIAMVADAGAGSWRLEIHDSLPSTSDACITRAEAGEPAGLAILARHQTRARGSRGRSWTEPPTGNLALSILLWPTGDLGRPALWPLLAGLALHDALGGRPGDAALTLKWPNDVLLRDAKLAGILVERGTGGGRDWLVIGFGANLAQAPLLPDRRTASLAELGVPPTPDAVAHRLLAAVTAWHRTWQRHGFDAVRAAWLQRAQPIGARLAVRLRGEQRTGTFAGLAPDGALLLALDGREERIETGDILTLGGS